MIRIDTNRYETIRNDTFDLILTVLIILNMF